MSEAKVVVQGQTIGAIGPGLMVLVAAGHEDLSADAIALADKIAKMRIFADEDGKMNRSLLDTQGAVLAVSQFTLFGDARKGRRPSFVRAMEPVAALELYEEFLVALQETGIAQVERGKFGAHMELSLLNDGPVTILVDTKKLF